jgi:basic amino acid/polyamine antiporter, APA family
MPKLWNKKPIAALQAEAADIATQEPMTTCRVPLKRTLSAMSLIALGIGNIIGAGIFVLTGQAATAHAGPAIGCH